LQLLFRYVTTHCFMNFCIAGPSRPNSLFYEDSTDRMPMLSETNIPCRDSLTSTGSLLDGVDPDFVLWATASSPGCRVSIKDSLVSLTIPEGALNSSQDVFCAVISEDKDRPILNGTVVKKNSNRLLTSAFFLLK